MYTLVITINKEAFLLKRTTIQKTLILQAVESLRNHPSAEEIYTHVAGTHPTISRGTVYRNLTRLAEDGTIRRVVVPNGADCFDFHLPEHYHLKCNSCNRIFDVDLPYDSTLVDRVPAKDGFTIGGYELIFLGLCPECQINQ